MSRSLTRRMLAIAAAWTITLLVIGGFFLERAVSNIIVRNFDAQLEAVLNAMIATAEIGSAGEVQLSRALGDQRYQEPYSGLYWQISTPGQEPYRSRSLWDRALTPTQGKIGDDMIAYDSDAFPGEPLRIVEQSIVLPDSSLIFRFQVAHSRAALNAQLVSVRSTLMWSLGVLGLGLIGLASAQATYGLWPLRRIRKQIVQVRSGASKRVSTDFPTEISPLVTELNELLEHTENQAEAARMHAGNLAHALKTPMAILINEATRQDTPLSETVRSQLGVMGRHIDHHLARARALGRRAIVNARAPVWHSLEALQRTVERMYEVTIDIDGVHDVSFRGERQDFEEMVGNLIDNAAKYGGGRVFVTVASFPDEGVFTVVVEDDGKGVTKADRAALFERGARLDTGKPGTGLGLAIVKDVAEIYGGSVTLGKSEDLGGLAVTLTLPLAENERI